MAAFFFSDSYTKIKLAKIEKVNISRMKFLAFHQIDEQTCVFKNLYIYLYIII